MVSVAVSLVDRHEAEIAASFNLCYLGICPEAGFVANLIKPEDVHEASFDSYERFSTMLHE